MFVCCIACLYFLQNALWTSANIYFYPRYIRLSHLGLERVNLQLGGLLLPGLNISRSSFKIQEIYDSHGVRNVWWCYKYKIVMMTRLECRRISNCLQGFLKSPKSIQIRTKTIFPWCMFWALNRTQSQGIQRTHSSLDKTKTLFVANSHIDR